MSVTHEVKQYAVIIKRGNPVDWLYYKFATRNRIIWVTNPGRSNLMIKKHAVSIANRLNNGDFDEQMGKQYTRKDYRVVAVKTTYEVKPAV